MGQCGSINNSGLPVIDFLPETTHEFDWPGGVPGCDSPTARLPSAVAMVTVESIITFRCQAITSIGVNGWTLTGIASEWAASQSLTP